MISPVSDRRGDGVVARGGLPALRPRGHGGVAAVQPARHRERAAAVVEDLPRGALVRYLPAELVVQRGGEEKFLPLVKI